MLRNRTEPREGFTGEVALKLGLEGSEESARGRRKDEESATEGRCVPRPEESRKSGMWGCLVHLPPPGLGFFSSSSITNL